MRNTAIGFTVLTAICWTVLGVLVFREGDPSEEDDRRKDVVRTTAFFSSVAALASAAGMLRLEVIRSRKRLSDESNR